MKDSLILEGKTYISAGRAAKIVNYTQDYIGQLCRANKLDCKMVGRIWFVTEASLLAHRETAADATQERILKIVKEVMPVATPVVEKTFTYEAEEKTFLPQITKKVPAAFSLPKTTPRFSEPRVQAAAISTPLLARPFAVALVVVVLAAGGLFSTFSLSGIDFKSFSVYKGAQVAAVEEVPAVVQTKESNLNGIGIIPATKTTEGDAAAKEKIANSFSDEVTVRQDKNGAAGVITPIFKKGKGEDFLYVMVPVKEKK